MGQILHKCAKTTERIRVEIQQSKESIQKIAKRYNVNPKTVIKWRSRDSVSDMKMGTKSINTVLTETEEAIICAFRKKTLLSLDDCYISLKDQITSLTRSNLHRCLQRHGLSVLPKEEKEELIKDLDNTQKTTREEILKVQNHLKYITINERLRNR